MEETLMEMKDIFQDSKATFECESLPDVHAVPFLMIQLFSNILHNSLKYASSERKPVMEVFASKEPEINQYSNGAYCHWITFKDNGIGFEQE